MGDGLRSGPPRTAGRHDHARQLRGVGALPVGDARHHVQNTVATFKHILAIAIKRKLLRESPAAELKRLGKIIRVQGSTIGEHGEALTPMEREALASPDVETTR